LRAEASQQFKPFKDVLPSGFGQAATDAIEDRLLDAVKHAGPSAAEQVKQNEQPETAPEPELPAKDRLIKEADSIREDAKNWTAADCELDDNEDDQTLEGFAAYHDGRSVEDCPHAPDDCDLWLYGFVSAERAAEIQAQDDGIPFDADDL
jgi:hypothetical protein